MTRLAGVVTTLAFLAFLLVVGGSVVYSLLSRSATTIEQIARALG